MKIKGPGYYKLLPRSVVVVSTISENGISNAAPFSFNSPISINPPIFGISCQPTHDTWRNIRENGEFVVNIVGQDFGPLMHILEQDFPYGVSEIKEAGLTEEESKKVKPPRIKEAYAWFECKMESSLEVGDHILIAGRVLEAEIRDEFFDKVVNVEKAEPLGHISGPFFVAGMEMRRFKRA
ncbi:MAG: flavin reductase family protein [Candidatus Hydrothermarchaeales archaeon]